MAKKETILNSMEEELNEVITRYCRNKAELEQLKKQTEEDNSRIKKLMELTDKTEYVANGFQVNIVVQHKDSFDEEPLMSYIQDTLTKKDTKSVIKVKQYVDGKSLEKLIYDGKLCEKEIEQYKIRKETVTLRTKEV